MAVDVLIVSLGATAGLRAADEKLRASLERAGADVALARAEPAGYPRTLALTDFVWARAARRAAVDAIAEHPPHAVLYSTITAALLWPRPGAIYFDALAAANRPGRHGLWQRPLERRRLRAATVLIGWSAGSGGPAEPDGPPRVVVPPPVTASGPAGGDRDIAAVTYCENIRKKGMDRVLAGWALARSDGEELVVAGPSHVAPQEGVRSVGMVAPASYRELLRRARTYVTAPRREDHGLAQLEALADGAQLVTTSAPGAYPALAIARSLDPRLVVEAPDDPAALARAIRTALDDPAPRYADRARDALAPYSAAAVDDIVATELLPLLLSSSDRVRRRPSAPRTRRLR